MNRMTLFILALILACANSFAGTVGGTKDTLSLSEVGEKLNSGATFNKETPFVARAFKPSPNKNWENGAVAYSPYRKDQAPGVKGSSESEIRQDLSIIIRTWNLIRVYGSDDATELVLKVIKEDNIPVKVMLGIWLEGSGNSSSKKEANIKQALRGIELANKYTGIVTSVSVGNETQVFWSGYKMKSDELINYIRAVRNNVKVPVTTADDYLFWDKEESVALGEETDFITTHLHPLWKGKSIGESVAWMDTTLTNVISKLHPGKLIVIGETGWATDFNPLKTGPGEQGTVIKEKADIATQAKFLQMLSKWTAKKGITTFLFEAFDESWKGGGNSSAANDVEKHWGVYNEDRTPKPSFEIFIKSRSAGSGEEAR